MSPAKELVPEALTRDPRCFGEPVPCNSKLSAPMLMPPESSRVAPPITRVPDVVLPRALLLLMASVPAVTSVKPVKLLFPLIDQIPEPSLINPPAEVMSPDRVPRPSPRSSKFPVPPMAPEIRRSEYWVKFRAEFVGANPPSGTKRWPQLLMAAPPERVIAPDRRFAPWRETSAAFLEFATLPMPESVKFSAVARPASSSRVAPLATMVAPAVEPKLLSLRALTTPAWMENVSA